MAAECELLVRGAPCGVLAKGRCVDCARAFCDSHTSRETGDYANLCIDCRKERRDKALGERATAKAAEDAPARIRAVAARLAKSTVQPSPRARTVTEKRFLRWVEVEVPLEPAWPAGVYAWDHPEGYGQGPQGDYRTGVTPSGRVVPMERPTDEEEPDRRNPRRLHHEDAIVKVAEAIERFAARNGL